MACGLKKIWALGFALALLAPAWSEAASVLIVSTDKAQTFSYGRAADKRLVWREKEQSLYADITFSNDRYAGAMNNAIEKEYFLFKIPGTNLDPATRVISAKTAGGQLVPIAKIQWGLFGPTVQPLNGTSIYILNHHGQASIVLYGTTDTVHRGVVGHWIETNDAFALNNLLPR